MVFPALASFDRGGKDTGHVVHPQKFNQPDHRGHAAMVQNCFHQTFVTYERFSVIRYEPKQIRVILNKIGNFFRPHQHKKWEQVSRFIKWT